MLYLEDYLEMIEHLPQELRDRFTEIRELDLQVNNAMDNLDDEVKTFFSSAKKMKPEARMDEYSKIKTEYMKTLEDAEEKVNLASQIYDLVERYLRRLDQELAKFKIELEADHSGITELLERRSLELDQQSSNNHHNNLNRDRRRMNTTSNNHSSSNSGRLDSYHHSSYSNYYHQSHHLQTLNSINSHQGSQGASRLNVLSPNSLNSGMISPASSTTSNGTSSMFNVNQLTPPLHHHGSSTLNSSSTTGGNYLPAIGVNSNPIAAAASQAIAATQSMQSGRRTASLKASIDAINSGPGLLSTSNLGLSSGSASDYNMMSGQGGYSSSFDSSNNRGTKRIRTASHFHDDSDEGSFSTFNGATSDLGWANLDPDEPRYCICQQVSYGEMVACDNADCEIEWFHYACVQLQSAPKGKWYCPPCTAKMKRRNRT